MKDDPIATTQAHFAELVGLDEGTRARTDEGFVEAARAFSKTLPPARELPDLVDLVRKRSSPAAVSAGLRCSGRR